jgi:hypothetical protein
MLSPCIHSDASCHVIELNYLSHGVLRLFEDPSRAMDDPNRFYVNVLFSPGAGLDPFIFKQEGHILPGMSPHLRHLRHYLTLSSRCRPYNEQPWCDYDEMIIVSRPAVVNAKIPFDQFKEMMQCTVR